MGDLDGAPTQAEINAQLLANHAELQAACTVTEQLAQIAGRNRLMLPSQEGETNPFQKSNDPNLVPEVGRPTTRVEPGLCRGSFTKAVQQILDRDGRLQDQLLIEEMVQLKIQDQAVQQRNPIAAAPPSPNQPPIAPRPNSPVRSSEPLSDHLTA
ncbi:hypothetical protein Bca52824_096709 [Brassica carinata]|uniref:Uncharacterized protein n=1 Tax=Brassica carinata TaxID=52824 RepID=A0A8X7TGW6_BRACI|nr:hypothetical protein Bca52824_096709 [Brassica carinata]